MPYIKQSTREILDCALSRILFWVKPVQTKPGDLNYILTKIIHRRLGDSPNYADYNEVIGVLESCKLELYRACVGPYEDLKAAENGHISELDKGNRGSSTRLTGEQL